MRFKDISDFQLRKLGNHLLSVHGIEGTTLYSLKNIYHSEWKIVISSTIPYTKAKTYDDALLNIINNNKRSRKILTFFELSRCDLKNKQLLKIKGMKFLG